MFEEVIEAVKQPAVMVNVFDETDRPLPDQFVAEIEQRFRRHDNSMPRISVRPLWVLPSGKRICGVIRGGLQFHYDGAWLKEMSLSTAVDNGLFRLTITNHELRRKMTGDSNLVLRFPGGRLTRIEGLSEFIEQSCVLAVPTSS